MNRMRTILQSAKYMAFSAFCWLTVHAGSLALAAPASEREVPGAKATKWVVSYGLVILGMGLGLLVILHASRRRDRAKPEAYEAEAEAAGEE